MADGTSVTIGYTVFGDANVDSKVNALDFNALAVNFGNNSGALWYQGDFNYDGVVNTADFNTLATNFNTVAPTPAAGTLPELDSLGAVVPEPASAGVLMVAAGLLAGRHRRNVSPFLTNKI